jgi:simple sugar transport system ATP-binding protein
VLLVSEDLDELLAMSDRLAVMFKGEVMGVIENPAGAPIEAIGLMMAGTRMEEAFASAGKEGRSA